jgi:hypothetical protein
MEVVEKYLPSSSSIPITGPKIREDSDVLVYLKDVCVSYHRREVRSYLFNYPSGGFNLKFLSGFEKYKLDR